ncbi:MAG TPA: SCO family protein [Candidatus Methylacidiphilales bacterium]
MRRSLLCLFLIYLGAFARADSITAIDVARDVHFDQNLGAQVALDLPFISETGTPVHLGDYFHRRPVILVLDYDRCPNLCGIVLHSMVASLKNITFDAGDRYEVVVVSIDPRDTPQMSALRKEGYLDSYERPQTAKGWHFLTGSPEAIKTLADTVGFHFVYDPKTDQYAHPSGLIVLTPEGKTSRYFFGVEFPSTQVRDAIAVAGASKVSSPVYDFLLLCCSYNPLQGKYGPLIFNLMRGAGILTVLMLGGYVIRALRNETARKVSSGSLRP